MSTGPDDRVNPAALAVGDALPPLTLAPISRSQLALFAGASGDHNPIHIDLDFARRAGFDDVFAHGMLVMAMLARVLTSHLPQAALRSYGVRFTAITRVHDVLICTARVRERFSADGEQRLRLEVAAADAAGERKLVGEAVVAVPEADRAQ